MGMCTVVSLCVARYSCLCDLEIQTTLLAKMCPLMWGWVCPEENTHTHTHTHTHIYIYEVSLLSVSWDPQGSTLPKGSPCGLICQALGLYSHPDCSFCGGQLFLQKLMLIIEGTRCECRKSPAQAI